MTKTIPRFRLAVAAAVCVCAFFSPLQAATLPSAKLPPATEKEMAEKARISDMRRNIVYKRMGDLKFTLDLMLPLKTTGPDGKPLFPEGTPLVLNIHGGGWKGGHRYMHYATNEEVRQFSDNGIALATVSYRFADNNGNTIADCVTDCFDAVRYLSLHAKEYGLDPSRMLVYGHSAGGHLTLMMLFADPVVFPGDPSLAGATFRFVGGVALSPATTFVDKEAWLPSDWVLRPGNFEAAFGGTPGEKHDLAKKVSPYEWLRRDIPRTLVIHGEEDPTISLPGSERLAQKARALGADLTLLRIPRADHGFRGNRVPTKTVHRRMIADNLVEMAQPPPPAKK